ncbi:MAG: leucine--tRNA ligase [Candidatus Paceibacterota bacterium]
MEEYKPTQIELKWQEEWEKEGLYQPDLKEADDPFYNLFMFPYPSAEGLHIGNMYAFTGSDIFGRFQRLQGKDVFEPIGFDAFGIHSENYALKQDEHPKELTERTTSHFEEQLKKAGLSLDWSHKVNTTKPSYYQWTQWLFLQLYKNDLAEIKTAPVNWCPSCKTVLADAQVIQGECERCDTEVEEKELKQWFLKITEYAEQLDSNLEDIDWSENVKKIQKNWIGKSEGAKIEFKVEGDFDNLEVFTTRPDTIFGATFMVVAPEHELAQEAAKKDEKVKEYINQATNKSEEERKEKEKSGVDTGFKAINPATGEKIPVWVSEFVLAHYGGGAIMAVPAHDQRDFEFAQEHNLEIKEVVSPEGEPQELDEAYEEQGVLINSEQFNDLDSKEAKHKITDWLEEAKEEVNYKLRDWLISRQRYWGPPIPIVYCRQCWQNKDEEQKEKAEEGVDYTVIDGDKYAIVPVPEEELPVKLPEMENFKPTGTAKAPLAHNDDFVNTECPVCGAEAQRETDVSDNFLDSAWYFFRYPSTDVGEEAFDEKITKKWLPVDMYIGGAEHACLHLMYTRFITMALHDMRLIDFEEPFDKFRANGMITRNGAKMSKSKGNVVNPDDLIDKYGADCTRTYLMFMGPFTEGGDFSEEGISGIERFLDKIWRLSFKVEDSDPSDKEERALHQAIKKVTEDIESLKYNTAIAAMMEYLNELEGKPSRKAIEPLVKMIAPFAPHMAEEIWREVWGNDESIFKQSWPEFDKDLIKEEDFTLIIQVNGDVRGQIEAEKGISKEEAKQLALDSGKVDKWVENKDIKKTVFVGDKLINFVV